MKHNAFTIQQLTTERLQEALDLTLAVFFRI